MRDALTVEPPARFGLLVLRNFFDERTCEEIVAEMRLGRDEPATVYGQKSSGTINANMRKAVRHLPSPETVS